MNGLPAPDGRLRPTPFRTVLVANRGEIALRIIRTARRLGLGTVAVYSSADAGTRPVREADRAVWIGEAAPSRSYLAIERIVAAARTAGADAVHPGYGFLAENEAFALACREAGLVFVGPRPETVAAMGDKGRAKAVMAAAGVPCIPGYGGEDQEDATLLAEALRIGFPVMIKATAGGGGRGMRLVETPEAFPDLLRSARSEAEGAFGRGEVILERAVRDPRHIEVQVVGDRYGRAIHLGERDCSVQRRHQKVIEEAPSPAVSAELRASMGSAAVKAARALGYEGAGTLEFLLDPEGRFYFMEMNTRLQVEHPVTEAITGLDLVELQFRVAAGEPLPLGQEDVRFAGHAIEARLCAEDPDKGFAPRSGRMGAWQAPAGLRVESALESGADVPPDYDSMVAKVIAHGASREEARRRLAQGLEETVALGVATNRDFLIRCVDHPDFAAGRVTTAFVERHAGDLLGGRADEASDLALAAVLLHLLRRGLVRPGAPSPLAHTLPVPLRFALGGRAVDVALTRECTGGFRAAMAGREVEIEVVALGDDAIRFRTGGVVEAARFVRDGAQLHLQRGRATLIADDLTFAAATRGSAAEGSGQLRASMSGRVVRVLASAGDRVAPGQPIVTLEAMKMEHVHAAAVAGVVAAVSVSEGEQVAANRVLAEIRAEPERAP